MSARILVVDGNPSEANAKVMEFGARAYGPAYADVLQALEPDLECVVVRPCEEGPECLPQGMAITDFDGVAWSGSALNIYEPSPEIDNQLRLAEACMEAGLPIFGSCWGLQLFATALGGRVQKNPNGRELGVVRDVTLTDDGLLHPMLEGRPRVFHALGAHRDDVADLPPHAVLLAGNAISHVQAFAVEHGGVNFWGTQYHPEIDYVTIAAIIRRTRPALIREGLYASDAEIDAALMLIDTLDAPDTEPPGVYASEEIRTVAARGLELTNWLQRKVLNS